MRVPRILLVDDDTAVCFVLERTLQREQYMIDVAGSGRDALEKLATHSYDLILLDLHMEPIHGLDVFKAVREKDRDIVVLILTAYGSMETAIQALRLGAFDYLFKPAEPCVIRQKVQAGLAQRQKLIQQQQVANQISQLRQLLNQLEPTPATALPKTERRFIRSASLLIDTQHRVVTRHDQPLDLTTAEFAILLCLVQQAPQVVSPQQLVRRALSYDSDDQTARDIIKYHIHKLRHKVEADPTHPRCIKTVRYEGYMWAEEVHEDFV
jgi:DNA-binding response OmpR family regulator